MNLTSFCHSISSLPLTWYSFDLNHQTKVPCFWARFSLSVSFLSQTALRLELLSLSCNQMLFERLRHPYICLLKRDWQEYFVVVYRYVCFMYKFTQEIVIQLLPRDIVSKDTFYKSLQITHFNMTGLGFIVEVRKTPEVTHFYQIKSTVKLWIKSTENLWSIECCPWDHVLWLISSKSETNENNKGSQEVLIPPPLSMSVMKEILRKNLRQWSRCKN